MSDEACLLTVTDAVRFFDAKKNDIARTSKFKPIAVKITQIKEKVTRQQQAFLFGVVYPALQAQLVNIGYDEFKDVDDEEMHNAMKTMFFFKEIRTKQGFQKIPKTLKLGKANRDEVIKYINDLLDFGSKIGVAISEPQDEWYQSV